jgi:hypothetical protein
MSVKVKDIHLTLKPHTLVAPPRDQHEVKQPCAWNAGAQASTFEGQARQQDASCRRKTATAPNTFKSLSAAKTDCIQAARTMLQRTRHKQTVA